MKQPILTLAIILASFLAHAQDNSLDTLGHDFTTVFVYEEVPHLFRAHKCLTLLEKADGDIIADMYFRIRDPSNNTINNLCNGFYTISRQNFSVVDSTFLDADPSLMEDNTSSIPLLACDPDGTGYVYAKFVTKTYDKARGNCTWLEIMHCDENFHFDEDVAYVTLEEKASGSPQSLFLEKNENIVARYVLDGVPVVARVRLDGTLLDKRPLSDLFHGDSWSIRGMATYNESPLQYAIYGWDTTPEGDTTFLAHVVDSTFNLLETIVPESESGPFHYFDDMVKMLPYDDAYFVVSKYYKDNQPMNGLRIAKYDKASHGLLCDTLLLSQPVFTDLTKCAFPIGLQKTSDGNLCLAYRSCNVDTRGHIYVMKMDANLNMKWLRQCYTMKNYETVQFYRMQMLEYGVFLTFQHTWVALFSGNRHYTMMFLINDNGTNGTPEMDKYIRPYAFYPNPTQDQLHLQYSPDVQPKAIELYDLQGRLVRKQGQGLENIELQGLTTGQYLMKVTMEDGKTYTDKVVKE